MTVLTFRMRQADLEEDLQKAFQIFDRDGDGYITVKELRYLMTNLGERYTEEEVTEMIREVDLDCKGKVDFHGNKKIVRVVLTFNASKRLYFLYASEPLLNVVIILEDMKLIKYTCMIIKTEV